MAKFGQYETGHPQVRTGFNAIYVWRPAEKGSPQRIIKAHQPSVRVRDEKLTAAQSQAFLDSAGVQQKAALQDAKHWAPIHEFGTAPAGVFYVTDRYDLSARQLVDGRVNLRAAGMHHIVDSITAGLLTLKRVCGRPHGNLKFSNILVTKHRDVSKAKVVLCDPLPAVYLEEEIHSKADLQQVGELIHRLVLHRRPPLVAGYQVPDSEEWRRLGKHADDWRGLCNRLLLTDVEAEPITLEQLAAKLATMAPRRSDRILKIGLLVCVVVLLGLLGRPVAERVMDILHPPDPEEVKRALGQCREAHIWLVPLWEKLAVKRSENEQRCDYLSADDKLKSLIRAMERYDNCSGFALKSKEITADEDKPKAIRKADDSRRDIEAILFDSESRDYWPWLKDLRTYADKLSSAKCQPMADHVRQLITSIGERDGQLAERIDDALYLKLHWPKPDVNFDELEPSAVYETFRSSEGIVDTNDFLQKLLALRIHYRLFGAGAKEIDDRLKVLSTKYEELETELRAREEDDPEAKALLADLGQLDSRLAEIDAVPRTAGNRDRIRQECEQWEAHLEGIGEKVKGSDEWYDDVWKEAKAGISGSDAINDWYRSYLAAPDRLGGDKEAFAVKYESFRDLRPLKDRVEQTRENLKSLDARLPQTIPAESIPAPWGEEIRQYYEKTKREELITAIIVELGQKEPFPDPNEYDAAIRHLLEWPDHAAALICDFNDIERGLNGCYALDDQLPWTIADILSLYAKWESHEILKEKSLTQALDDLTTRVERLKSIRDLGDLDSLLALAGDETEKIEARYAVWRRLTSLGLVTETWPAEENIRNQLREQFEAQRGSGYLSEERWGTLTETLDWVGQARARQYWNAVIDGHIEAVVQRAAGVPLLERFAELKPERDADLSELKEFAEWAADMLAEFLTPEWFSQYDLAVFADKDRDRYNYNPAELRREDVEAWQSDVAKYARIDDPREEEDLQKTVGELKSRIKQGYEDSKEDPKAQADLKGDESRLGAIEDGIREIADLPAIRKYEAEIDRWNDLRNRLKTLEGEVDLHIWPPECKHLLISNGRVAFRGGFGFDRFEPDEPNLLAPNKPNPLARSNAHGFQEDASFGRADARGPAGPDNLLWPKYIRSRQDPNVVLRFIPQEKPTDPSPFYMAIGEATNAQYLTFLKRKGVSTNGLILDTERRPATLHPYPSGVLAKGLGGAPGPNHPVVWVTFTGAEEYAHWLGTSVPTTAEHERAAVFADGDSRNYTNPDLHHIRTSRWADAARQYNADFQKLNESFVAIENPPVPPGGAVDKGGEYRDAYEQSEFDGLPEPGRFETVWPAETRAVREVAEVRDLYDLVGNVWEWCLDGESPRICGGSCLSPLSYARPDAVADPTSESACDLGFRVVVRCPKALGQ